MGIMSRLLNGREKQKGFSLLELMVTLLIVGILAAVAIPSYQSHVTEARRSDATTMLVNVASLQEQYFLDNKTYAANMTNIGFSANPFVTENGYYQVQVQAATASCPILTCYIIEAAPQNAQSGDSCGTLTINSQGTKLPSGCW